jgi:segregation and condensation protein B
MGIEEDKRMLEAALHASDRPLTLCEIGRLLGTSSETYARKLLEDMKNRYRKRGGPFTLEERGHGAFSLHLKEEVEEKLGNLVPKLKVSRGAMKTLAMIAYKQNLTLAKLASLRGSRTYEHVRQLVGIGFVESKPFGRTRQLRTTQKFASYFGLADDVDVIREWMESQMQIS